MTRFLALAMVLLTSGAAFASDVLNGGIINGGVVVVPEPGTTVLTAMALAAGAAGIIRARRTR